MVTDRLIFPYNYGSVSVDIEFDDLYDLPVEELIHIMANKYDLPVYTEVGMCNFGYKYYYKYLSLTERDLKCR